MILPKEILIDGQWWKVEHGPQSDSLLDMEGKLGCARSGTSTIHLKISERTDRAILETLCHEIYHVKTFNSGLQFLADNDEVKTQSSLMEAMVVLGGVTMVQLFVDNPNLLGLFVEVLDSGESELPFPRPIR